MESLLLTATVFAVVLVVFHAWRSERPGSSGGLGLFAYKDTKGAPESAGEGERA